jgi:DNA repair exonuclease SbcCD nuclease subunit
MSLVVSADFHVGPYRNGPDINGVNGRLLDIKARMWEILDFIRKRQVSNDPITFIMAGDAFVHKHPSIPELTVFSEFIKELISLYKVESYIFPGNHDASKVVGQPHALAPFIALTKDTCVHIVSEPTRVNFGGGCHAYFFPYQWHSQDKPLAEFTKDATDKDYLFVHGTIEGGVMSKLVDYELFDEDVIRYDTVKKFRAVFAGHLHDAQHFNNVWYPGSPERLAFGDELSPKSFLHVFDDGKNLSVNTIPLPNARKMVTMHYTQLEELKQGRMSVKDAIVRITGVVKGELQNTRKALVDAGCYFVAGLHSADQIVNELPKATSINVSEFVRRFAEKTGYKGDVVAATRIILDTVDNQL